MVGNIRRWGELECGSNFEKYGINIKPAEGDMI
jgi:hypothetical protein